MDDKVKTEFWVAVDENGDIAFSTSDEDDVAENYEHEFNASAFDIYKIELTVNKPGRTVQAVRIDATRPQEAYDPGHGIAVRIDDD
jgi:hypothetical protein